jgi:hypothetical protein
MPVKAKKLGCCSARSTKLKAANFAKASKAAQEAQGKHTHMKAKKASAKKHPAAKKAKPCRACGKK